MTRSEMQPSISICIPTYNDIGELERTLQSLTTWNSANCQESNSIEVIISDNCSTDETKSTLENWQFGSLRLQVVTQLVNLGFKGNLEFLARSATAPWILYMFSGDVLGQDFLPSHLIEFLSESRENTIFFGFQLEDSATGLGAQDHMGLDNSMASQSAIIFGTAPLPIFRTASLREAMLQCVGISGEWWPQVEWSLWANRKSGTAGFYAHHLLSATRPRDGWWTKGTAYLAVLRLYDVLNHYSSTFHQLSPLRSQAISTLRDLPAWIFQTKVVFQNHLGLRDIAIVASYSKYSLKAVGLATIILCIPTPLLELIRRAARCVRTRS